MTDVIVAHRTVVDLLNRDLLDPRQGVFRRGLAGAHSGGGKTEDDRPINRRRSSAIIGVHHRRRTQQKLVVQRRSVGNRRVRDQELTYADAVNRRRNRLTVPIELHGGATSAITDPAGDNSHIAGGASDGQRTRELRARVAISLDAKLRTSIAAALDRAIANRHDPAGNTVAKPADSSAPELTGLSTDRLVAFRPPRKSPVVPSSGPVSVPPASGR